MNLPFDYTKALYRKNNYGQPCVWYVDKGTTYHTVKIYYGILGKSICSEEYNVFRKIEDEIQSKINAKRKVGYKYLNEVRDDFTTPVKESLIQFLTTYLPEDRTTSDGSTLAMLAKSYDKVTNPFKNTEFYLGQWKINGLRCFVRAIYDDRLGIGLFGEKIPRLLFQSREGTYWNSLNSLENYLLKCIPEDFLNLMLEENYVLDGELYIPGYTINDINSAVKTESNPLNKLVQYWCYDIAIEEMSAHTRNRIRATTFRDYEFRIERSAQHLATKMRFLSLPSYIVGKQDEALSLRNKFIELGFEGLILRNPDAEYQFGKRNMSMLKYKKATDGIFEILDIYPEGTKREDLPLFKCRNDINDATFECHVGGDFLYQQECLLRREQLIGKKMFVQFGERSGVNHLPFHIKTTRIIDND